jgi:hypothetical protein
MGLMHLTWCLQLYLEHWDIATCGGRVGPITEAKFSNMEKKEIDLHVAAEGHPLTIQCVGIC